MCDGVFPGEACSLLVEGEIEVPSVKCELVLMRVEAVNRRWMKRFLSREMRMKKLGEWRCVMVWTRLRMVSRGK